MKKLFAFAVVVVLGADGSLAGIVTTTDLVRYLRGGGTFPVTHFEPGDVVVREDDPRMRPADGVHVDLRLHVVRVVVEDAVMLTDGEALKGAGRQAASMGRRGRGAGRPLRAVLGDQGVRRRR